MFDVQYLPRFVTDIDDFSIVTAGVSWAGKQSSLSDRYNFRMPSPKVLKTRVSYPNAYCLWVPWYYFSQQVQKQRTALNKPLLLVSLLSIPHCKIKINFISDEKFKMVRFKSRNL